VNQRCQHVWRSIRPAPFPGLNYRFVLASNLLQRRKIWICSEGSITRNRNGIAFSLRDGAFLEGGIPYWFKSAFWWNTYRYTTGVWGRGIFWEFRRQHLFRIYNALGALGNDLVVPCVGLSQIHEQPLEGRRTRKICSIQPDDSLDWSRLLGTLQTACSTPGYVSLLHET
jgi:hypothetical protein